MEKKGKKEKKEKELLEFITDFKKEAKTMSDEDIIKKLLDKTPKDTENEPLKVSKKKLKIS